MMRVLITTFLVLSCSLHAHAQVSSSVPQCRGAFDFYFVLDTSGSVRNNFQSEVVPFVKNVSNNFINPDFRLSFVTFATVATVYLNLTANRREILQSVEKLENINPSGSTNLSPGLAEVNMQIDELGGDTASVILVITDGSLQDSTSAYQQADAARRRGATIFAVGVGSVNPTQLQRVAGGVNRRVFQIGLFSDLQTIINEVVNDTCIEIQSANPQTVCTGQSAASVELIGRGFTNTPNHTTIACRILVIGTNQSYITRPTEPVQYNRIVCEMPLLNQTSEVLLQVTLNGISYISSNVTLFVDSCNLAVTAGIAVGVTAASLLFLLALLLLLLWFFFPLLAGVTVQVTRSKPPQDPEQPEATPPKKWETVDASYYGGGGAGGIKPVTVRWGDKGATEEGNKLSKSKDANVVATHTTAGSSYTPRPTNTGCWSTFKSKVLSGYTIAASYRPLRGEGSKVVEWQPFKDSTTTVTRTQSTRRSTFNNQSTNPSVDNKEQALTNHRTMSQTQRPTAHQSSPRQSAPTRSAPPRPAAPPRPPPPRVVSAVLPGHSAHIFASLRQSDPPNSRRYTAVPRPKVPAQRPISVNISVVY